MDALCGPIATAKEPTSGEPPPEPTRSQPRKEQARRQSDSGSNPLPSRERLLGMLLANPRMLLSGLIFPATANAMTRTIQALLRETASDSSGGGARSRGAGANAGFNPELWRKALLQFPELGNDAAQFFGPEALDALFGELPPTPEEGE